MKKFFIRILAFFLKSFVWCKRAIALIFRYPLKIIGRVLFYATLPVYKLLVILKRIWIKFYSPFQKKHNFIHPFSRRYIIHVLIIIFALLVSASNLNAYEVKTNIDTGYDNLLSKIVIEDELDVITEEGPIQFGPASSHYFERIGVEKSAYIDYDDFNDIDPSIVAGGGAIVKPILSPTEIASRQRNEIVYHTIQPGETISGIAEAFGISVNTILWENNLTAYSIIRPGQQLTLLPVSGIRHKVIKGDTLSSIAKKYTADETQILDFNKLASAKDIQIGESLIIPGGRKEAAVKTYALRWGTPAPDVSTPNAPVVGTGKMLWPNGCKRVSQYYHLSHHAVDIACAFGSDIRAADAGTVIKAQGGWNGGYGLMVIIDHGNGKQTLYGHMSKILVQSGDQVELGQVIGKEGSTGRSTGPHLHFEVRVNGVRLNPLSYIGDNK